MSIVPRLGGGGGLFPSFSAYCRGFLFLIRYLFVSLCFHMSWMSRFRTHQPKVVYNIRMDRLINRRVNNSRTNIDTLIGSRTCTLRQTFICVVCYTWVLDSLSVMCFTINYEDSLLQRTKKVRCSLQLDQALCFPYLPAESNKQRSHCCCTCPSLSEPLRSTTYCNPAGASFVDRKEIS
jgi:hypothetical protein